MVWEEVLLPVIVPASRGAKTVQDDVALLQYVEVH